MPTRNLEIPKRLTRQFVLNGLPVAGHTMWRVLPQPAASRAVSVEGFSSRLQGREER